VASVVCSSVLNCSFIFIIFLRIKISCYSQVVKYRVIVPYTWVISPVNRYNSMCACCIVVLAIFNPCRKFYVDNDSAQMDPNVSFIFGTYLLWSIFFSESKGKLCPKHIFYVFPCRITKLGLVVHHGTAQRYVCRDMVS